VRPRAGFAPGLQRGVGGPGVLLDHHGGAGGVDGGMVLTLERGQLAGGAVVEVVGDEDPAVVRELTGRHHGWAGQDGLFRR
jgi:hypothetical protein